jgi:hypothetical protein
MVVEVVSSGSYSYYIDSVHMLREAGRNWFDVVRRQAGAKKLVEQL